MTCIVGLIENSTVFMGADSMASTGYNSYVRRDRKIFWRNSYLIGFTTSYRMGQLLMYAGDDPPAPPRKKTDLHRFMCVDWVNWVRKIYKEGGFLRTQDGTEIGGQFLVAVEQRLFRIGSDFQVMESACSFDAVGSGQEVALGSLFTSKDMPSQQRIHTALAAAEQWCKGVGRPFYILNTGQSSGAVTHSRKNTNSPKKPTSQKKRTSKQTSQNEKVVSSAKKQYPDP